MAEWARRIDLAERAPARVGSRRGLVVFREGSRRHTAELWLIKRQSIGTEELRTAFTKRVITSGSVSTPPVHSDHGLKAAFSPECRLFSWGHSNFASPRRRPYRDGHDLRASSLWRVGGLIPFSR